MFVTHERKFPGTVTIDAETGLIIEVEEHNKNSQDYEIIMRFLIDYLIFTGFGDPHVHCRQDATGKQNYKETFLTACLAAINGGVTFICDMPNNPKPPIDDASYDEKLALTLNCPIYILPYAGIAKGTRPLTKKVPYKLFMEETTGNLHFHSFADMHNTLQHYTNQWVSFHCGDPRVLELFAKARYHEDRRPAEGEMSGLDEAIPAMKRYNLHGKVCHCSICSSVHKIQAAKAEGLDIKSELTPTHLIFDKSMLDEMPPHKRLLLRMNPPLRTPIDRLNMIESLRNGEIDMVGSDHAGHSLEEKLEGEGMSGLPQLDTAVPVSTRLMKDHGFRPEDVARVFSYNPACFVNEFIPRELGKGFGRIEPGYVGSFTIINPNSPVTVTRDKLETLSGWSPYEDMTFPGSVAYTIIKGRAYQGKMSRPVGDLPMLLN